MKIADNSIDIKLLETFNFVVENIGTSIDEVKSISIDVHGGSHIDY